MRLDIGNVYDWFKNPVPSSVMPLSWFPRNFTNPDLNYMDNNQMSFSSDALYAVQLGLYVIGYKESKDDNVSYFFLIFACLLCFVFRLKNSDLNIAFFAVLPLIPIVTLTNIGSTLRKKE